MRRACARAYTRAERPTVCAYHVTVDEGSAEPVCEQLVRQFARARRRRSERVGIAAAMACEARAAARAEAERDEGPHAEARADDSTET